jgi:NADPH2:quinone reductase
MLMLEQDQLQHNIGARMSLDDIVQAHEMVERGEVTGNLVLKV